MAVKCFPNAEIFWLRQFGHLGRDAKREVQNQERETQIQTKFKGEMQNQEQDSMIRIMVHSNHGAICSCVGPMIDVQMKCKVFYKEKFMIIQIRPVIVDQQLHPLVRDVFFASVYDALLVITSQCNFRDGRVIYNIGSNQAQYFIELPFNDAYLVALIHLCCANYTGMDSKALDFYTSMCKEVWDINVRDIMLGFAAVFLFIKSYASCLVAELSQLWQKGVMRTIALGSTDGFSCFSCTFSLSFQPVIVPVGRIALGRILNVVGSSIDPYIHPSLSSQFGP